MKSNTGYASDEYISTYLDGTKSRYGSYTIMKRQIPGTEYYDLASVYPFSVDNLDYHHTVGDAITSIIITNPFDEFPPRHPGEIYKQHAITDLGEPVNLPENHRRNIKKCQETLWSRVCINPSLEAQKSLIKLYPNLIKRHNITGITAYTECQLEQLLKVPGSVAFQVLDETGGLVNVSLFYIYKNDVYYHLSAQSDLGYKLRSNFLMMYDAIRFFKSLGMDRLEIGASADGSSGDGLRRFKEGFSTSSVPNRIIKSIWRPDLYAKLSEGKSTDYFPAYRQV